MSAGAVVLPRGAKWGWGVVLAVSGLLVVNGVLLYAFEFDTQLERTLAILVSGVGLQGFAVALEGFRRAEPWAWRASWALAAVVLAVAIHALLGNEERAVGGFYLLLGIAVAGGLLLARGGPPSPVTGGAR